MTLPTPADAAVEITAHLEAAGVHHAIGVAIAHGYWGVPRGTQDLEPLCPLLDLLESIDVKQILRAPRPALHRDQIVDVGDPEDMPAKSDSDGTPSQLGEPLRFPDQEIHLDEAVRRTKRQSQHPLVGDPFLDPGCVPDPPVRFRNLRPTARLPQGVNRSGPGCRFEAWDDVDVVGDPVTAVEPGRDPTHDHELKTGLGQMI